MISQRPVEASVVEATGLPPPGSGFAAQVQSIEALALFARALPSWCRRTGLGVSFTIQAGPSGCQFDLGMTAGSTPEHAEEVIARLMDCERLVHLELLVDEMRNVGVAAEILDPMIAEASALALRLHPAGEQDPTFADIAPPG